MQVQSPSCVACMHPNLGGLRTGQACYEVRADLGLYMAFDGNGNKLAEETFAPAAQRAR